MTRCLFLLLLLTMPIIALAQQEGKGKPFVKNYAPKDYQGHAQNWAIKQDNRGVLFAGNGNGVMSYDGNQWKITELPDKSTARSMAIGPDQVLYVGTSTEFGYMKTNKQGKATFVNLALQLPDSLRNTLTDFWETFATNTHIYFRTYYVLIEYAVTDGKIRFWDMPPANRMNTMFVLNNQIYVHILGKGVFNPNHTDSLVLAPEGQRFITDSLKYGVTFPYKQDTIILSGRGGELYKYPFSKNKAADDLLFSEANNVLKNNPVYTSAIRTKEGYILGSLGSGLLVFNQNFKFLKSINAQDNGLKNETIYCLAADRDGAIWVGGANGVGRIDLGAEISFWDQDSGLLGSVYWVTRHKGVPYIATSSNFYSLDDRGGVKKIEGIDNLQCWHSLEYINPADTSDIRLLVSAGGIHELRGNKTEKIVDKTLSAAFKMHLDPFDPYRVWVAYSDGFGSIKFDGKGWVTEPRIPDAEENNRSIQVAENGDIWVGTFRKGAMRLIKQSGERNYTVKRYTAATHGLLSDKNVLVFKALGQMIFATDKGLCTYNSQTDRFEPFCEFGEEFCNGSKDIFSLQEDAQGNVWVAGLFSNTSGAVLFEKQADGTWKANSNPFKKVPPMMTLALTAEPNGRVWLGGSERANAYKL